MGDRATIQIVSGDEKSPVIYLHWAGSRSIEIIKKAAPIMRAGDLSYAAARLIGVCHIETDPTQGLSLGIFNNGEHDVDYEVDLATGAVRHHGRAVAHVEFGRF